MSKNKTSTKTFQCKDLLWQVFEDMSKEYGMSNDYLINTAMLEFAHSKGFIDLPKRSKPKYSYKKEELDDMKSGDEKPEVAPPKPPVPNKPPIPPKKTSPKLYITCNGEVLPVDKKKFIIGRGSNADLRLADPSVSRNHALVIHKDGAYYIKDMGSTNGVEFEGKRHNIRKISDGETYAICNFEFTFNYVNE